VADGQKPNSMSLKKKVKKAIFTLVILAVILGLVAGFFLPLLFY